MTNTNRFLEVQLRSVLVECEKDNPEEGVKSERYIIACQSLRQAIGNEIAETIITNVETKF